MVKDLQNISSENKARFNAMEKDQKLRYGSLNNNIREMGRKNREMESEAKEDRDTN